MIVRDAYSVDDMPQHQVELRRCMHNGAHRPSAGAASAVGLHKVARLFLTCVTHQTCCSRTSGYTTSSGLFGVAGRP